MGKKRYDVEVISYSPTAAKVPKKKIIALVIAMVVVAMAFSTAVYFLVRTDEELVTEEKDLDAVIDLGFGEMGVAGPEFKVWEGESFTLSANWSNGSIEEYVWDMDGNVETGSDDNPRNDRDRTGIDIHHAYNHPGVYTIRLWIYDHEGEFDKTQGKVFVSGRQQNLTGSTSGLGDVDDSNTFDVPSGTDGGNTIVKTIYVNMSYDKGGSTPNSLNLTIYNGDPIVNESTGVKTPVLTGTYVFSETATENKVNWVLSEQWVAAEAPGVWSIAVSQVSLSPLSTIDFRIEVQALVW